MRNQKVQPGQADYVNLRPHRQASPLCRFFASIHERMTPHEFEERVRTLEKLEPFDPCAIPCDREYSALVNKDKERVFDPGASLLTLIIQSKNAALLQHVLQTYGNQLAWLTDGFPLFWHCVFHARTDLQGSLRMMTLLHRAAPNSINLIHTNETILHHLVCQSQQWHHLPYVGTVAVSLLRKGAKLHPVPTWLWQQKELPKIDPEEVLSFLSEKALSFFPTVLVRLIWEYSVSWWARVILFPSSPVHHGCRGCHLLYDYRPTPAIEMEQVFLSSWMCTAFRISEEDLSLCPP